MRQRVGHVRVGELLGEQRSADARPARPGHRRRIEQTVDRLSPRGVERGPQRSGELPAARPTHRRSVPSTVIWVRCRCGDHEEGRFRNGWLIIRDAQNQRRRQPLDLGVRHGTRFNFEALGREQALDGAAERVRIVERPLR